MVDGVPDEDSYINLLTDADSPLCNNYLGRLVQRIGVLLRKELEGYGRSTSHALS